jgi:hypothetical protein
MVKVYAGKKAGIEDVEDRNILEVEKISYPLGTQYGNTIWDGVLFQKGKKKVRVSHYGGGSGYARRGSLTESWSDEDVSFIDIEEFEKLLKKVDELNKIEDTIDKEGTIREFIDEVMKKY